MSSSVEMKEQQIYFTVDGKEYLFKPRKYPEHSFLKETVEGSVAEGIFLESRC